MCYWNYCSFVSVEKTDENTDKMNLIADIISDFIVWFQITIKVTLVYDPCDSHDISGWTVWL